MLIFPNRSHNSIFPNPSPSNSSSHVLSIQLLSSKPLSGELLSANLLSSEFLHLFIIILKGKCLDFKSIKVSEFSLEGYNASDSDSNEEKINIKSSAEGPGS
ncbi:hypothetical protein ZIOFF_028061 [Zingiber officinale]|uniref:Uncharacterized protein n=1 Tax=Zingiber officinale TaxID=94328 RepID=A0A8J5GRG6_ZINOF|nr:hypothetical protein ZIOFF_028061 [Zingiber officinale]